MKSIILAAAASAIALAAPAHADEFSGPHAGVAMTLDNVQSSGKYEGAGFSGVGVSGFAGYDVALTPSVFAGVEANIDGYTADDDLGDQARWGWGISGRLGAKVNDTTGLYARVGYARAEGRYDNGEVRLSHWFDGVRYGAGVETKLTDAVSLRAEFSQFNYEKNLINNQGTLGVSYHF